MTGLDHLNRSQKEAVTHPGGPVLVLAGAGSGKTGVITHRIAWLISDLGIASWNITAVTFTNKAASEMRDRVEKMMGADMGGAMIGTFHAMCLRILRRDGDRIGLKSGFNIYDATDQVSLVRKLLKDGKVDESSAGARTIRARISKVKNRMESPEEMERKAYSPDTELTARIYRDYEKALHRANAVDFDDILLRTLELFREHPDVKERYSGHCLHLLVDEYQDTNRPQYLLVRELSSAHGNLFVVGDEDQSIYRFRGAEIRNILDFEKDHPGAKLIRLEQNYRSTGTILEAAGAVIENNVHRKGKKLWTENGGGEPVTLYEAPDDRAEAVWVADTSREIAATCEYEQIAVLYRTNAQSRQLEEIFRRDRVPYQVVGSTQFYERKEIKDLLAYLKLAANPADDLSFRRIVNTPPRGIGSTTLNLMVDIGRGKGLTLLEAAREAVRQGLLKSRATSNVIAFLELVDWISENQQELPVSDLMETTVQRIGFAPYMEKAHPGQGIERMENLRALVSAAAEYADEENDPTLTGFLDRSALVSDADDVGKRPGVSLMTIHCAKGLEFDNVFMVGLEENLFPHSRSVGMEEDVEEERRLCYVAMTRARKRLLLARANLRRFQGIFLPNAPSRFLEEIPEPLIRRISPTAQDFAARDRFEKSTGSSAADPSARKFDPSRKTGTGPARELPAEDTYRLGASVLHPKFGIGRIMAREGSGAALKLTIRFDAHGQKKILPSYTSLKIRA